MNSNTKQCHGACECLYKGTDKFSMSPLLEVYQKYRSYLVWWQENVGLLGTVKHGLLGAEKARTFLAKEGEKEPGSTSVTCLDTLALQPGELVEVKPIEDVLLTLDNKRRNRGLRWMTGMRKYCGKQFRVYKRVNRIMLEESGEFRNMKDTVLLEGVMCDGREFGGCDRSCFHFWRESWLKRV